MIWFGASAIALSSVRYMFESLGLGFFVLIEHFGARLDPLSFPSKNLDRVI